MMHQAVLIKYLKATIPPNEFNYFVKLYSETTPNKFSVLKISGGTLDRHLNSLAEDIAFLNELSIYPIIIHGAGAALDKALPHSQRKDGIRITSVKDMKVIKEVFDDISHRLEASIIRAGGSASKIPLPFTCSRMEEYGQVGKVEQVELNKINLALDLETTPIISPLGISTDGYVNINADTAARALAKYIKPHKLIHLTETGGVLDHKRKIIPFVNISDLDGPNHNITGGMKLKLKEIGAVLNDSPNTSVTITSATMLIKELFTIQGSGTYIKSHQLKTATDKVNLDFGQAKDLLESAFNKQLVDNFFQDETFNEIVFEKSYHGIILLQKINGIDYMDKFAVAPYHQGTGLGRSMWEKMIRNKKKLMWRAAPENPSNKFYMTVCDGMVKQSKWTIFWIGLNGDELIPAVRKINKKRVTLIG